MPYEAFDHFDDDSSVNPIKHSSGTGTNRILALVLANSAKYYKLKRVMLHQFDC